MREYKWRNKTIPTDDIEHGFFLRDVGGLRGMGPLQLCGAAVSAAVEADEWASRFFGRGGVPSVVLKTAANSVTRGLRPAGHKVAGTSE